MYWKEATVIIESCSSFAQVPQDNIYLYVIKADNDPTSYQNIDINNPSVFAYEVGLVEGGYVASELLEKVNLVSNI